jgi:hypothetical protein
MEGISILIDSEDEESSNPTASAAPLLLIFRFSGHGSLKETLAIECLQCIIDNMVVCTTHTDRKIRSH